MSAFQPVSSAVIPGEMAAIRSSSRTKPAGVEITDHVPEACSSEIRLLLGAVRATILGQPIRDTVVGSLDWDAFVRIAEDNRFLILAARSLAAGRINIPESFLQAAERYRALTLRLNGANLVALRKVIRALSQSGINVVVLKGPSAQFALYGDYFVKPSTDIDLLVAPESFAKAGQIIEQCGYVLPPNCASPWWSVFLGEQHYLCSGAVAVDLHHRTQQPGCPSPRSPRALLKDGTNINIGGSPIPIQTWQHACLVSCMNLVKGVTHREPTGAHACDIAAGVAARSDVEIEALLATARDLGLSGTLLLGLRVVNVLFGLRARGCNLDRAFPFLTDAHLLEIVLEPQRMQRRLPRRTRILWGLCDNAWSFGRELFWKLGAETARVALTYRS